MYDTSSILDMTSINFALTTEDNNSSQLMPTLSSLKVDLKETRNHHRSTPKDPLIVPQSIMLTHRSKQRSLSGTKLQLNTASTKQSKPNHASKQSSASKANIFSFNKTDPNRTLERTTEIKSNMRKINFEECSSVKKGLKSTSSIKQKLMRTNPKQFSNYNDENNEQQQYIKIKEHATATSRKPTTAQLNQREIEIDLKNIDFDYGKLSDAKIRESRMRTLAHNHPKISEFTVDSTLPIDTSQQNSSHKNQLRQHFEVTLKQIQTVRANHISTNTKPLAAPQTSSKKPAASYRPDFQISSTTSKKGRSCDNRENIQLVSGLGLVGANSKLAKISQKHPEKKRLNSRILTMFSHGKIQTKVVCYPDNSQYLRLCGIKN